MSMIFYNSQLHGVTFERQAKSYIGINLTVSSDRKVVELDMVASIQQLVDKHLDKDYRSYSSPAGNDLFELTTDSTPLPKGNKFLSIVMSLMYIARLVRPDILLSVVYLSTRSQEPTEQDYKKLLRILSYLKATIGIKLRLSCDNLHIQCHCDASYGSHHDGGSHTGYWISLGTTKSYLYAKSVKQKIFATSSTEAELVAAVDSVKTITWIQNLINEINIQHIPQSTLYQDNKSVIFLIKDISKHRRSTDDMVADTLTKALQGQLYIKLNSSLLGVRILDLQTIANVTRVCYTLYTIGSNNYIK
mmetsp:Transcript_14602/g.13197  ORF Transcript_14602/g.13197 Transcript_14602/m.13197 type:complete len:304 (-) Transcript_14602:1004-1915(-)